MKKLTVKMLEDLDACKKCEAKINKVLAAKVFELLSGLEEIS